MQMSAPAFGPGETPPAVAAQAAAQQEPAKITYLRDSTNGRVYPWTDALAGRDNMVALDQYKRIVPNAPMAGSGQVLDPAADPSPAINGVAKMSHIEGLRKQMTAMQDEIAALRTEIVNLGG